MKRVPLWGAIVILVVLFFLAIGDDPQGTVLNREAIWTMFGINLVLVIIGIVRAVIQNKRGY